MFKRTFAFTLRAVEKSRAVFFIISVSVYVLAIVSATLSLHPYFAQTWDVQTFIHAARTLADDTPLDLYAQSRAAHTWPYAYPPLHAFVVALALFVGDLTRVLPDYVWARVPVIVADVGVAIALYHVIARCTNNEWRARVAALLWLFNPVTFYDTAVQGHFESEWLVFVLLAYIGYEAKRARVWSSLALAIAVLFKQIAIIFALPVFAYWLWDARVATTTNQRAQRWLSIVGAVMLFALVIGGVCLPFVLYSDDFVFMNFTYVENVPVQTSSWMIAVLGLTRAEPKALTSDFVLIRYSTIVTILVATILAFIGARRGWSLYLTATLIALAFFLTSRKVMGYYYVMLLPFLLVTVLAHQRDGLLNPTLIATAYLALAPYYAAWTNHAHWWVYALLGTAHSLFFVWLFVRLTEDRRPLTENSVVGLRSSVILSLGLFTSATIAAWLQPLVAHNGSPIRAPLVMPGLEARALFAFVVMLVVLGLMLVAVRIASERVRAREIGSVFIFAPLFFSVYTLTKETTAIFEMILTQWGV
ncbi:MAG: hypothetical protein N2559_04075 [Anaerolineae bacterium]|nr:hypothetical protein [Anaerolineae bacterium]